MYALCIYIQTHLDKSRKERYWLSQATREIACGSQFDGRPRILKSSYVGLPAPTRLFHTLELTAYTSTPFGIAPLQHSNYLIDNFYDNTSLSRKQFLFLLLEYAKIWRVTSHCDVEW